VSRLIEVANDAFSSRLFSANYRITGRVFVYFNYCW